MKCNGGEEETFELKSLPDQEKKEETQENQWFTWENGRMLTLSIVQTFYGSLASEATDLKLEASEV